MLIWLTSDWHLGEDRFEIMSRTQFRTQIDMIHYLQNVHNSMVERNDKVIVVGDVCYQKYPEFLKHVAGFNGVKTLVRGNHDKIISDAEFLKYFDQVIPDGGGIDLEVEGIPCYATHYPNCGKTDRFNLVGHVHSAWKYQLNMLNVGIDVNHFQPIRLDSVPWHFNAIKDHLDDDIWAAYYDINARHKGIRGKPGAYFN